MFFLYFFGLNRIILAFFSSSLGDNEKSWWTRLKSHEIPRFYRYKFQKTLILIDYIHKPTWWKSPSWWCPTLKHIFKERLFHAYSSYRCLIPPPVWPKNVGPTNWFVNCLVVWFFAGWPLDIAIWWQEKPFLTAWASQTWKRFRETYPLVN